MNNLPYTIAGLLGITSIFLAVCGLLYLFYLFIKDEKAKVKKHEEFEKAAEAVLRDAHAKAEVILQHAQQEAQQLLGSANELKQSTGQTFQATLNQVEGEMVARFKHDADEFDKQYNEAFNHLKQEYAKKADQTFATVEQMTREEFDKKMNAEFENVKKQIQEYRNNQLLKVNEEINKIVVQVVREVIGRSITMADHEKLVMQALEEAKQEGVFAG